MDEASAELLSYLAGQDRHARPWLIGVARRPSAAGFKRARGAHCGRGSSSSRWRRRMRCRLTQTGDRATSAAHARHRGRGAAIRRESAVPARPAALGDRTPAASAGCPTRPKPPRWRGSMRWLPRIVPASVARQCFGQTFHPRMLAWFADEGDGTLPGPATWTRLQDLFDEEADGYLRFRRSLLRDAAYEGLPYKLRRRLHGTVAARIAQEADDPDEVCRHPFAALSCRRRLPVSVAVRRDRRQARRRGLCVRRSRSAVHACAGSRAPARRSSARRELAAVQRALGDAWYRAAEFRKAAEAYAAARRRWRAIRSPNAELLLKLSRVEEKLGQVRQGAALGRCRRAPRSRDMQGQDAARQTARSGAWYATVLQSEGRTSERAAIGPSGRSPRRKPPTKRTRSGMPAS